MNVGRLAAAAKTILQEFQKTQILNILISAINLAANRGQQQQDQYNTAVEKIRSQVVLISQNDIVETFPSDMAQLFLNGTFSRLTPSHIAQVIFLGITNNKNTSISSAELHLLNEGAESFVNVLQTLVNAFTQLNLDYISVPEGLVSLDILIPRVAFDNKAARYINILASFNEVLAYLQEAAGGPTEGPELVYTSTTDPVTGIGLGSIAIMSVLTFYEKILDVAKKQIDFLKSIKEFRAHAPDIKLAGDQSLDDVVKNITRKGIADAAEAALTASGIEGNSTRRAELSNGIELKSSIIVSAVANGARISISLESLMTFENEIKNSSLDYSKALEMLASTKLLERAVTDNLRLFNESAPLLENFSKNEAPSA